MHVARMRVTRMLVWHIVNRPDRQCGKLLFHWVMLRRWSPRMQRMAQEHVDQKLARLPDWSGIGDAMQRTFSFENFSDAIMFVDRVAQLAEDFQHHPDILIRYNKVTLTLSTHDAGGLTDKDFALAREIDEMVAKA